jgi:hypothetical protein
VRPKRERASEDGGEAEGDEEKKKRAKKDPNAPKRPAGGAFGCFLAAKREAFVKECPDNPIAGVTKLASAKWKEVSEVEKAKYQKQYEAKKVEYEKAMAAYTKTTEVKKNPVAEEKAMTTDVKKKPATDEKAIPTAMKKPAAAK